VDWARIYAVKTSRTIRWSPVDSRVGQTTFTVDLPQETIGSRE